MQDQGGFQPCVFKLLDAWFLNDSLTLDFSDFQRRR